MKEGKLWDIFCRVIDNYGDIGVGWRLASGLAARGERVRLWLDDASALQWMAPAGASGVEVRVWSGALALDGVTAGDVLLEAFGCEIDPIFVAAFARKAAASGRSGLWINLEYLSAEAFVERSHGLRSPVAGGPGAGLAKYFYYPGFTAATGGLLREPELAARQARFERADWLRQMGIDFQGERLVSLFCYEPPALAQLLTGLADAPLPTRLLVTHGRASAAVKACIEGANARQPGWNQREHLLISSLPALTQDDFDHLLWSCDLNFVRGEDSLLRALWAGKPLVWQIYPQTDGAHHRKLDAFLDWLEAPPSLRAVHEVWNGGAEAVLPALEPAPWQRAISAARQRLLEQDDLVSRLLHFVQKNH